MFEGVVYHCVAVDVSHPCRPTLEVDARTQDGDLDAGPLLVTVEDWGRMVGDTDRARRCLQELQEKGRLVDHLGAMHVSFPTFVLVGPDM